MMQRVTFAKGHSVYQVGKLNWTPLPFEAKRSTNIPSKRYLHSAVELQGKLYILGGIDNDTDFKDQRMYCLDLATMKWTIIEGKGYCEGRNSHACAVFKNQIYFFGGSQQQSNPSNDFFKFSPAQGTWTLLQCEESVPAERELAIMASVNDQYLFLLGGIDIIEDKIFDDAFLFNAGKWSRLNISDAPSERIRMAVAVSQRRIFAFGGEGPGEHAPVLFDNLYEVTINEFDLEMSFTEVHPRGTKPKKRTAHAFVAISPRFLLLYGGEGRLAIENGNSALSSEVLGDIWIYDVQQLAWTEIETLYGSLTPRYQFTLTLHRNELFIFGGMNEQHAVVDDLAKLEFIEEKQDYREQCKQCTAQYAARINEKSSNIVNSLISTGFYYNLALEVVFPFRAVQIISEVAEELGADTISINSAKSIEDFDYLSFEFNAKKELSNENFLHLAESNENPSEARLMYLLKIGALRLGKTFLYIEAGPTQRRVMLMSVDGRFSPNFEDCPMHYSYIQSVETGQCFHGASYGGKQAVANILRTQITDPYTILSRTFGNLLVIFQLNILPTIEKAYYYQLIFYSHPDADIKIYHNEKKAEMLESLGYCTNNLPDFSCRSYLKYSKLKRKIKPCISNNQVVPIESYLDYLKRQKNLGTIQELQLSKFSNNLVQKCVVYQCIQDNYLQNNQGVLVYCGNQLIDRIDCKLGQLISDKFFKKKYKKRHNLFKYTGVLYISSALKLNLTKTKPVNRLIYQQIIEETIAKIKQARSDHEQEKEMGALYSRFVYNRQTSKRLKKDNANNF